jgi:molybdopterin synthase catalytic subunit
VIRLVDIRDTPISVDEVLTAVDDPAAGGVVSFTGLVRASDSGKAVVSLEYSAHPSAIDQMTAVVAAVDAELPVVAVAAVHRVGLLAIGDVAVVVAASAAHRDQAFLAARRLIDDVKASVPIWKHQVFEDGAEEWVGTP